MPTVTCPSSVLPQVVEFKVTDAQSYNSPSRLPASSIQFSSVSNTTGPFPSAECDDRAGTPQTSRTQAFPWKPLEAAM